MRLAAWLGISMICLLFVCGCSRTPYPEFHDADTVQAYLTEQFAGHDPQLSREYKESKYRRVWTFTLKDYPDFTFHVTSKKHSDMFGSYKGVALYNDAYVQVAGAGVKGFEGRMQSELPSDVTALWKGIDSSYESYFGFHTEEGEPPHLEVSIQMRNYEDVEKAQMLMDAAYTYLHEYEPELSDIGFATRMQLDRRYDVYGGYYMDDIDFFEDGFLSRHAEMKISLWNSEDLDKFAERASTAMLRYYILMADTGNGITEEQKKQFAETFRETGSDGLVYVKGNSDAKAFAQLWLTVNGRAMIAERIGGTGTEMYITQPEAFVLFQDAGLSVAGNREKFTVAGIDGEKTAFDHDKNFEGNGAAENNMFLVDSALVKKISGIDLNECLLKQSGV